MGNVDLSAIGGLVEDLSGLPVVWDGDAEPAIDPARGGIITLSVTAYSTTGVDEVRQEYDAAKDTTTKTVRGNRLLTISIKCETFPDYTETSPLDVLEGLRMAFALDETHDRLNKAQASFREFGGTQDLSGTINDRDTNVNQADLLLNGAVESKTTQPGGVILSVDVGGTANAGTVITVPPERIGPP